MPRDDGFIFSGGREIGATRQCVHCGGHFYSRQGSGIKRGWCMNCNGITCGCDRCDTCVPFQQWLDNVEKGRPEQWTPATASVLVDVKGLA